MSPELMSPPIALEEPAVVPVSEQTENSKSKQETEPPAKNSARVEAIISRARTEPPKARGAWCLSALTAGTLWASFHPLDWGMLGWVVLVPMLLLVRIPTRTRWMYRALYFTGLVGQLVSLQWMRLGDPAMYVAWFALAFYLAWYFPIFVALTRTAVHRLALPFTLAVPLVWVGLEYLQAHLFTGFSWYYLGHTQYRWTELIQVSDLVGAYGVSFLVALGAATLAGLVPLTWMKKLSLFGATDLNQVDDFQPSTQKRVVSVAAGLAIFLLALGYGYYRRAEFRELAPETKAGPRVALIQGNFSTSLKHDPKERGRIIHEHHWLTGQAVKSQPDLIVWPETMYRSELLRTEEGVTDAQLKLLAPRLPANYWREHLASKELAKISKMSQAALIIGVDTLEATPERIKHYNSAAFVRPQDSQVSGRYDKMHRVIFGEYIPLQESLPWLRKFTPFSADFGLTKGEAPSTFTYKNWNFSSVICFEDTVPQLVRGIVSGAEATGEPIDVLVNLTNDGWFHPKEKSDMKYGSSASEQHLVTASFRAVETRTPLVRAVNTGISAFVDGEGVIREPEKIWNDDTTSQITMRNKTTGRFEKQFNGYLVETIPLDPRTSLYTKFGDWFAQLCLAGCVFILLMTVFLKFRKPAPAQSAAE